MKSKIALVLAVSVMSFFSGTGFAAEKSVVYNNRGQVTATVTPAPAAVKKTLVWNNRGQLIAVVPTPAR